jgi:predicted permease
MHDVTPKSIMGETRQQLITAWHRVIARFRRARLDRDLDDELAFHLAMREAECIRQGVAPDQARETARRAFGGVAQFKEQAREMWTFPTFESLLQDVRYALRALGRSPAFSIVAITALAIGIGGNTAIFSVLDAVRAQALPYHDGDRLVELWGNVQRARIERRGASYPDYLDWRAQSKSFVDMAAFDSQWMTLAEGDEPERLLAESVSAQYFSLLGVSPVRGRVFEPDEDLVAKPGQVVVLSDGLWKRRFGADPAIVGRTLTLCCAPRRYTVVGVMPPGFKGLSDTAELWFPFALWADPSVMTNRGTRGFAALARLRPGVSLAAAQRELDGLSRQLERTYPDTNVKRGVEASPLDVELFGALRPALWTIMTAVVFVLLIACANVANLLIARSEARQREIAVRTALGAGWPRLLRQLITEGCVLTALGATAGLLLAQGAVRALLATSPVTLPSFVAPRLSSSVALFTVIVTLICGVLLGLAPAAHARVSRLGEALKDASRGSDGRRSQRMRGALVVAELSLAVVLLVGAGLMIRSVRNLAALNPGFDPDAVLTLHLSIPRTAAPPAAPGASPAPSAPVVTGRALIERLAAVPGVTSVGLGNDLPLDGGESATFYSAEGQPAMSAQDIPRAYIHRVSPAFFSTLRIPLVGGRTFTDTELTPDSPAVIVSQRVVTRFWPGQDPVGKRIKFGALTSQNPWLSIVGVAGEVKYRGLPDNPTADPDIYLPFADRNSLVGLVIRTAMPPASLVEAIRASIRAADSSIPIYAVAPMADLVGQRTAQSRFTMWLMAVFAATALLLASVGIYGVMSYLVAQRTREIGIRLALGAGAGDILRLVVGNGARLIGAGIAIGLAAALALEKLVSSMLFGVTAGDVASGVAVAILAGVAFVACYVPALRATRVDPLRALHHE